MPQTPDEAKQSQARILALEAALQSQERFLSGMGHELRTPLNAIIGFTGTLLMKLAGPLTAEQERQLRTVQASGRQLLALVNDLPDLARIEAGRFAVELQPTPCRAVLEEVGEALRPLAEAKGLAFELQLPPAELAIRTDGRALRQILLNLGRNAIKYTAQGRVSMRVERDAAAARFFVEDSGAGLTPAQQEKLFEALAGAGRSGPRAEGTGLGLHIAGRLAALLGGRIAFRSDQGRGSTFLLELEHP